MTDNYIIKRMEELRQKQNMSYYELSKRAGMTQSSISNLISRQCTPKISTLEKICDGFGITLAQFFSQEGYPDLSEEQITVLDEWGQLSGKEKHAVKICVDGIKSMRYE